MTAPYGLERTLTKTTFGDAIADVTRALATEGFGVLTTIDVQATFKKKLDVEFRPYVILGACNPRFAHEALSTDPQLGLLLPCNVVVQDAGMGDVSVSVVDPVAVFGVTGEKSLEGMAAEVRDALVRVLETVTANGAPHTTPE